MKFVPKPLVETADVSADPRARRLEFPKLILWAAGLLAALFFVGGWIAEGLVGCLTARQEAALFSKFRLPDARPIADLPADLRDKGERLQAVLDRLRQCPDVVPLDYRLSFMEEKKSNAFALPGGGICVTTGFLKTIEDDIALAFVIGHELGHFAGRDHLRGLGRGLSVGIGISLIFGEGSADVLARRVHLLLENRYSRERESAADRFALRVVRERYGTGEGALHLFEMLERQEKLPSWAYMFATHPNPRERIRALRDLAAADQEGR